MDRRAFLSVLTTLAEPLFAEAPLANKVVRIGYLGLGFHAEVAPLLDAFREGLRERGWVERHDYMIEYRWAEGKVDQLDHLVADLVGLNVDAIVAGSELPIRAAKNATTRIPIIMASSGDAGATGLVSSLARPGGNVTGLTTMNLQLQGKRLQVLTEMLPGLSRVGVLLNGADPVKRREFAEAQPAARQLGITLHAAEVRGPSPDFDGAFAKIARDRVGALLVLGDALLYNYRAHIWVRSARHRMPTLYETKDHLEGAGLVAYGPSLAEMFRRAAGYVDRILKGAKPSDLPVEQPTKFELTINLKTAKALGLTIPASLLARADQVIE